MVQPPCHDFSVVKAEPTTAIRRRHRPSWPPSPSTPSLSPSTNTSPTPSSLSPLTSVVPRTLPLLLLSDLPEHYDPLHHGRRRPQQPLRPTAPFRQQHHHRRYQSIKTLALNLNLTFPRRAAPPPPDHHPYWPFRPEPAKTRSHTASVTALRRSGVSHRRPLSPLERRRTAPTLSPAPFLLPVTVPSPRPTPPSILRPSTCHPLP